MNRVVYADGWVDRVDQQGSMRSIIIRAWTSEKSSVNKPLLGGLDGLGQFGSGRQQGRWPWECV